MAKAQEGSDSVHPKDLRHAESANESLATRLQAAAPSSEAYTHFRAQAAALLRNNKGSAAELYQTFVSLYGQTDASLLLFLDLAELAPNHSLRSHLIRAAGFDTIISDAQDPAEDTDDLPVEAAVPQECSPEANGSSPLPSPQTSTPAASSTEPASSSPPKNMTSTDTGALTNTRGPALHGAPAPILVDQAAPLVSPTATSPPQQSATTSSRDIPSGPDDSPEDALEGLGFSSELWGVDKDRREHPAARGAKRKRSRREGGPGGAAAAPSSANPTSALSLLEGNAAKSAGAGAAVGRPSVVYWIRQDFRLHDNPALSRAVKLAAAGGGKVLCVYVHSPGVCCVECLHAC